jgi:hypothetical protein
MSFFVPLDPLPGEPLLGGYLVRLCESNLLPKMGWIFELVEDHTGTRVRTSLELIQRPDLLETLERLIPTRPKALTQSSWKPVQSSSDRFYWIAGEGAYDALMMTRHAQVCPQCLAAKGHVREEWLLGHLPVCSDHGVALIDTCPACHRSILNDRSLLGHCHRCGASFQEATPYPVSEAAQKMARSMLKHQGLLLGHAGHQEELSLNECARLFLLIGSTLNSHAKALYAPSRCDALPLAQRLATFELMAAAWSDGHLDSSRIRELLLNRWPYLGRISETLRTQRLDAFLVGRHLHMHITNMIRGDDPEKAVLMAVHQPNVEMPYIQEEADAADYLGISVWELNHYQMATRCLNKTEEDWGYDADQLLAARKLLNEALSDSGLDTFLGLEGASKTLQGMGLLKAWSDYAPDERKFAPWDIQNLYDQMWGLVQPVEANTALISLGELVSLVETDEPGAELMSQVLNQELPIRAWLPPYRFSDIYVEKAAASQSLRRYFVRSLAGAGYEPLAVVDGGCEEGD